MTSSLANLSAIHSSSASFDNSANELNSHNDDVLNEGEFWKYSPNF